MLLLRLRRGKIVTNPTLIEMMKRFFGIILNLYFTVHGQHIQSDRSVARKAQQCVCGCRPQHLLHICFKCIRIYMPACYRQAEIYIALVGFRCRLWKLRTNNERYCVRKCTSGDSNTWTRGCSMIHTLILLTYNIYNIYDPSSLWRRVTFRRHCSMTSLVSPLYLLTSTLSLCNCVASSS